MLRKNIGNKNLRVAGHTFDPSRGNSGGDGSASLRILFILFWDTPSRVEDREYLDMSYEKLRITSCRGGPSYI